jgi:hypothetical protein
MDWSAEAIEQLRALWAEGHSTAEIGRRMGISKNAVVGKAHRLHLPAAACSRWMGLGRAGRCRRCAFPTTAFFEMPMRRPISAVE